MKKTLLTICVLCIVIIIAMLFGVIDVGAEACVGDECRDTLKTYLPNVSAYELPRTDLQSLYIDGDDREWYAPGDMDGSWTGQDYGVFYATNPQLMAQLVKPWVRQITWRNWSLGTAKRIEVVEVYNYATTIDLEKKLSEIGLHIWRDGVVITLYDISMIYDSITTLRYSWVDNYDISILQIEDYFEISTKPNVMADLLLEENSTIEHVSVRYNNISVFNREHVYLNVPELHLRDNFFQEGINAFYCDDGYCTVVVYECIQSDHGSAR